MTDLECKAIDALAGCTFLPGSFDKRIARQWHDMAKRDPLKPMTVKGRACLWRLVWKYRRQIGDTALIEYAALTCDVPAAQKALDAQMSKRIAESNQPLFAGFGEE
jgi:hypothetical protein